MTRVVGGALHAVVFDVNVYLDVARLLGPPFSWDRFNAAAAKHHGDKVPGRDRRVDALKAIAVATSEDFAGPDLLQVWTSNPIDAMVRQKAISELGWSQADAEDLVSELVWTLAWDMTDGGSVGDVISPFHSPPLDYEDGCVYAAARDAGLGPRTDIDLINYCVTGDKQFREAANRSNVTTLHPHEWVQLVQRSRSTAAMAAMFRRMD